MGDKFIVINKSYLIELNTNNIIIFDKQKNIRIIEYIFPCLELDFIIKNNTETLIKIFIKNEFLQYNRAKCLLNTFYIQLKKKISGLMSLYKGTISIRGFNYKLNVIVEDSKPYLYFFFGLKYSKNFLIPAEINVEFVEKFRVGLSCYDLQLLNKFKLKVQKVCYPSVYKIKGIYFDDFYPKPKRFDK